jgi:hypothetical protein
VKLLPDFDLPWENVAVYAGAQDNLTVDVVV